MFVNYLSLCVNHKKIIIDKIKNGIEIAIITEKLIIVFLYKNELKIKKVV